MKISLVTASFNSSSIIRDTIESVLSQTYQDIEYIIIDGLSKDGTVEIIKEYEPLFEGKMIWISEKDKGIYDAMNKGFRKATGDVIGVINSGDLLTDTDVIAKVMQVFNNTDTDCIYANLYYVSQNNTNNIVRYWNSGIQRKFSKGWHPAHPTFYVKRNIYDKYGLFNLKYKLAADFEIMLRLVEKHKISMFYLPKPLVKMRLGGATSKNLQNIIKGNIECYNAFKDNQIPVSVFYPLYRILPKLKQFIHNL